LRSLLHRIVSGHVQQHKCFLQHIAPPVSGISVKHQLCGTLLKILFRRGNHRIIRSVPGNAPIGKAFFLVGTQQATRSIISQAAVKSCRRKLSLKLIAESDVHFYLGSQSFHRHGNRIFVLLRLGNKTTAHSAHGKTLIRIIDSSGSYVRSFQLPDVCILIHGTQQTVQRRNTLQRCATSVRVCHYINIVRCVGTSIKQLSIVFPVAGSNHRLCLSVGKLKRTVAVRSSRPFTIENQQLCLTDGIFIQGIIARFGNSRQDTGSFQTDSQAFSRLYCRSQIVISCTCRQQPCQQNNHAIN